MGKNEISKKDKFKASVTIASAIIKNEDLFKTIVESATTLDAVDNVISGHSVHIVEKIIERLK